jgi:hypothetical protein
MDSIFPSDRASDKLGAAQGKPAQKANEDEIEQSKRHNPRFCSSRTTSVWRTETQVTAGGRVSGTYRSRYDPVEHLTSSTSAEETGSAASSTFTSTPMTCTDGIHVCTRRVQT